MKGDCFPITGGPSVGKTTLIRTLRSRGYSIRREAGTMVIRHGAFRPEKDRMAFQRVVLERQLKIESRRRPGQPCFCDRGLLDGIAYLLNDGLPIPDMFHDLDVSHYRACFLLEPLGTFEPSAIRAKYESLDFTLRLTPLLEQAYAVRGIRVIRVPNMPVIERAAFIENSYHQFLRRD